MFDQLPTAPVPGPLALLDMFTAQLPLPAGFGGRSRAALRPVLQRFTHLRELQRLYEQAAGLTGLEFVAAILRHLQITVEYDAAELRRVPAAGAFIAVANHPSGMLDGLVLLHVLGQARPELRTVANELLAPLLPQLHQQFVLVQPDAAEAGRNVPGLRRLLQFLHNDVPLLLFPAGEVAHRHAPFGRVEESAWHPTAGRLVQAARLPVLPVWVSGHNSPSFNWLGLVHPLLRTARLPAELLNKRGQTVRVRIGQAVGVPELHALPAEARMPYLRARVHALSPEEVLSKTERLTPLLQPPVAAPAAVVSETQPELIEADLAALRPSRRLVQSRQWEVYVARRKEIPHVLREIGRLRELTFRREGEGTQQAIDLDRYDEYYRHLFVYDRAARRLVAAYRIGPGQAILRQHGRRGFYLNSLFRLQKGLKPLLRQSLELGRSWVREEYQRQPLPLALLWKGIAAYLGQHPEYRYLIGPVSISNRFTPASKGAMVEFITRHCFDAELATHVQPRKRFRYRPLDAAERPGVLLQPGVDNIEALGRLVAGIEPRGLGIPTLLRQYVRLNARFIGFNVDPAFSNSLDGFIVLDASELPDRAHQLLSRLPAAGQ